MILVFGGAAGGVGRFGGTASTRRYVAGSSAALGDEASMDRLLHSTTLIDWKEGSIA